MAHIEIRNLTDRPVLIREFYTEIQPGGMVSTERSVQQLQGMVGLHEAVSREEVTLAVTLSDAEKKSGLIFET
jgi:hypothetical protein